MKALISSSVALNILTSQLETSCLNYFYTYFFAGYCLILILTYLLMWVPDRIYKHLLIDYERLLVKLAIEQLATQHTL